LLESVLAGFGRSQELDATTVAIARRNTFNQEGGRVSGEIEGLEEEEDILETVEGSGSKAQKVRQM